MKIGFIGTGTIMEAIVTGIARSELEAEVLVVSPRNATIASRLAVALPFVASRMGPTIVYPPDPETMRIFDAIGGAIGVESLREYQAASVGGDRHEVAAGVQEVSVRWLSENGMAPAAARAYVSGLHFGIAAALASPATSLDDVRRHYSTVGGINEQCYMAFRDCGSVAALEAAMDAVLERVSGTPTTPGTLEGEAS